MIAAILMILGTAFLCIAAIGVVRLPDAFQRMHAGTKAGTLGTMLVLVGALLAGDAVKLPTGVLTILFLLLTLPVAAQLLGRAAYMSGATLRGLRGEDPLAEVVERQKAPLEERLRG
ncbi:Sodium/proton antiporter protein shaG [Roseomonas mucosa]|uniref:Sodium/proton antiporter protein shaG n=1 Tax=Roseomonas mucosa TaxID=207340 RepID=A0A4Y1MU02_9PROT|nr:monovalent cation/H(+) antiporter subunit G [Roseomonas mucosa]AWV21063.1 Sodium/proton antiporter protein shaG [Roseomonas mucosa]MDT8278259.1 monovalent cation/H(+) antiporter subunit G [Roseomonas mucosa]MDT8352762.1 monovalent cation/H(+) antiporter subunit G [Roseomonas mucosa]MDU7520839.1 monovalent cation/H(+) antiporter subunit G [Roseomonas mucosa]